MIEEVKTSLIVGGFTHKNDIDTLLELQPSILHEKGEGRTVGNPPIELGLKYEENTWILNSQHKSNDVETTLIALLGMLKDKKEAIKEIAQKYETEISIVIYFKGANPGFHVTSNILDDLSSLGANLDVDMYCLGEED